MGRTTHAAAGNRSAKTDTITGVVTSYAYDYRKRLTGVTIKTSGGAVSDHDIDTYDALNRCIGTNVNANFTGSGTVSAAEAVA